MNLVLLCLLAAAFLEIFYAAVIISTSKELEHLLCNDNLTSNHLILNSSVDFTISSGQFCISNPQYDTIFIQSSSNGTPARITCTSWDASNQLRRGFGFFNCSVTFQDIFFINCGTVFSNISDDTFLKELNHSSLHYTFYAAVLLFVQCQINIVRVDFLNSSGFAILAVNIQNSTISSVNVSHSVSRFKLNGCGIIVHYSNRTPLLGKPFCVLIDKSTFGFNVDFLADDILSLHYPYQESLTVVHAAGLTILYAQQEISSTVIINNTSFLHNEGSPGGLLVLKYNTTINASTTINNCVFRRNVNNHVSNPHATPKSYKQFGAGASVVAVESSALSITFNNVTVEGNKQSSRNSYSTAGVFIFYNVKANISGTFRSNNGSAVYAIDSYVFLLGNVTFNGNFASNGAAIRLSNSFLYFMTTSVSFINNFAFFSGGAIYSKATHSYKNCSIQVLIDTTNDMITFHHNIAFNSGSSIFMSQLFNCYLYNFTSLATVNDYEKYFSFTGSHKAVLHMSTYPVNIVNYNCTSVVAYPGQQLTFCVSALDEFNRSSYSPVELFLKPLKSQLALSSLDHSQIIKENNASLCTPTSVTLHSFTNDTNTSVALMYVLPGVYSSSTSINLTIKKCPLGFELHPSGICVCASAFNTLHKLHVNCDINKGLITRENHFSNLWIGIYKDEFGISPICPVQYCFPLGGTFDSSVSTRNNVTVIDKSGKVRNSLCLYNRQGTLCSKCKQVNGCQLSIVFGSCKCQCCSNLWIMTIILYIIAGPFLIYLLYALQLTLTVGSFNGIILFAHATNFGILDLMSIHPLYNNEYDDSPLSTNVCRALLSILNLNLGFPLCFYDGMTQVWKSGLSLLFPLYLLGLLVGVVIISRYSVRVSNKISPSILKVFATVIHLSFSNVLLAIIDVFTPTYIYTSAHVHKVWFFDGTKRYGKHSHLTLMIATLVAFTILALPYVTILILSKPIRSTRGNAYVQPLLEAIHAPYKESKQYWFVARIILLVLISVIYAVYRGKDLIKMYLFFMPLVITYALVQVYLKPFKSKVNNVIDCWFLWLLILLLTTTWYFLATNDPSREGQYATICIIIYLFSVLVVVIYHILTIFGKMEIFLAYVRNKFRQQRQLHVTNDGNRPLNFNDSSGVYYGSCNFREPLLDSAQ